LSLWFLDQSKVFIILQMRDETYERFKNQKPLDTYKSGVVFHISPPRFLDVVKRRLELIPVPDRIGLATTAELDCCKLTEAPQMPRASDLRY
jgi:hypothetical protein